MGFKIARPDGKSDADILLGIIEKAGPGDVIKYVDLQEKLSYPGKEFDRAGVQSVVSRSERKLAVNQSRALLCVRNVGYKVALASEHQTIAGRKRERSSKLLKRGLTVLQHVDWAAMSDNERRAHEGQLMIVGAIHSAMQGIEQRLARVENAIQATRSKD